MIKIKGEYLEIKLDMGPGYRPFPPRTASSIHRPSVSQTLAWRWGLAPRSQVRAERYCPLNSDCYKVVCFVGTNSLSALRWNSNGGYVASSLRQLCLILSVSNTTLYNKQNFVQQASYWTLLPHVDLSGDFRPGQCWGRVRWLWTPTTRPLARPSSSSTTSSSTTRLSGQGWSTSTTPSSRSWRSRDSRCRDVRWSQFVLLLFENITLLVTV